MQFGGNDQWSNIIAGVDLIRRVEAKEAYGLTFTLLTTKDGRKMGKTESGALWLDPNKTTPFEFFQYWRNIDDQDVKNCMRLLTSIDLKTIEAIDEADHAAINAAKETLAFELTKLVHSEQEALQCKATAQALFSGEIDEANMPSTRITLGDAQDIGIVELLVACTLSASKSEARRLIEQGGIMLGGEKVESIELRITKAMLEQGVILKKGKKIFHKATL